ncbi:hypothetical protein LR48_Vigan843s003100 [Vigna angularis]|uniref:Uncharacterized protein n=2 Tax=Phaseolus angularis TaxID=3914 RepID=A0A0L9TIM1_PHAAN|nr:hypothetical protein LR48_Vigan843s003100 [Vigna angularis]BAT83280.1 hypothetical protein VIGAN_04040800 [Vigna angularis var. angularis]
MSLQITFFPNKGFSIGINCHHAVLDGKSSTMFVKAWAYACRSCEEESPLSLKPELEPLFDRDLIKDPTCLETAIINNWTQMASEIDLSDTSNGRSLKIMSLPTQVNLVRAMFDLKRGDLEKIKKRVLSKWSWWGRKHFQLFQSQPLCLPLSLVVLMCLSALLKPLMELKMQGNFV